MYIIMLILYIKKNVMLGILYCINVFLFIILLALEKKLLSSKICNKL